MSELEIKRLYLDGMVLKEKCPQCKKEIESDLGSDYLSYPNYNDESTQVYFYCEDCDEKGYIDPSFEVPYMLSITLEKIENDS